MPAIRFEASIETLGGWTIVRLPKGASAKLPSRGQVMVAGTVNSHRFQTALEPDGNGSHWLHVDRVMQKAARLRAGDTAKLAIEATKEWPEPVIPADVQAVLKRHKDVRQLWDDVTPMARWEWLRWIGSTSQAETRQRRIEVSCSKLRSGLRRPCCFNRSMCCVPEVSRNGVLLPPAVPVR